MALLGMNDREFEQHQLFLSEAVRLIGQDAYLFPVESYTEDINSDKDVVYEKARKIGLLFESNPRPILKKYQWLTEDDELPYLAYIVPLDHKNRDFEVTDYMMVKIASERVLKSERLFDVTNVRGVNIDPLMWVCKLVPHRPKIDMIPETAEHNKTVAPKTDTGYSYLKRGNQK